MSPLLFAPAPLNRILFCDTCGTWTKHVLAAQYYVCACGSMVIHIINNAPKMWAIR